jgi:hypothetical protein
MKTLQELKSEDTPSVLNLQESKEKEGVTI